MGRFIFATLCLLAHLCSISCMSSSEIRDYRERARHMFQHAYDGYMQHGYPYDEVKPLTCRGFNTWGNFSLTLVDSLDTLIIMGNMSEFENAYNKVIEALNFDVDFVTSVFESNIRVLGGLLSAHMLLHRTTVKLDPGWPCTGPLLDLAVDLADRLLPAFDTPTKMPYGSINLRHGVPPGETTITCAAGVGTFVVEFGVLSRLTGDMRYESAALAAMQALHNARFRTGLVQSHVDVATGQFTVRESSIGSGMDSYFEYMLKGGILLHNRQLLDMFNEHYHAIRKYFRRNDWYLVGDAETGNIIVSVYQSLDSFFPGLQTLRGDLRDASRTATQYSSVWRRFGGVPEMFDLVNNIPRATHPQYPLRPELIESVMYLHRATNDPFWLEMGRMMLDSIDSITKARCGYCTILNVSQHNLEDRMHSYFLSETVKYLYLLFDQENFIFDDLEQDTARSRAPNWTALTPNCQIGVGGYVFSTEAHPFNLGTLGCCFPAKQFVEDGERADEAKGQSGISDDGWSYGAESMRGTNLQDQDVMETRDHKVKPGGLRMPEQSSKDVLELASRVISRGGNSMEFGKTHIADLVDLLSKELGNTPSVSTGTFPTGSMLDQLDDKLLLDSFGLSGGNERVTSNAGNLDPLFSNRLREVISVLGNAFPGGTGSPPLGEVLGSEMVRGQLDDFLGIMNLVSFINRSIAADLANEMDYVRTALSQAELFLSNATTTAPDTGIGGLGDLSESQQLADVSNLLVQADELLRERSRSLRSSRRYLDDHVVFEKDFYATDSYSTPPPGLTSSLDVFGGNVVLRSSVT